MKQISESEIKAMKIAISKRESILIIAFLCVSSAMGYYHFRFRPESRHLEEQKEQIKQFQSKLDSFKLEKEPKVSNESLQMEIDKIEEVSKLVEERLNSFTGQFVSLDSPENIQKLNVGISALARNNHVLITENISYEEYKSSTRRLVRNYSQDRNINIDSFNVLNHLRNGQYSNRPLRKVTLRARYGNLLRFMEQLNGLSKKATVVQMSLETVSEQGQAVNPQIIEAKLVLAL